MEMMKCVSHQHASQLLHNKFIVVMGDSIHRSVYKDLVMLLQKDKYLTSKQLKSKGEMSFEQDCLVEGGCLNPMHNGTSYREVRQFQSAHHLVRFYFVTRVYSGYMQSILEDFRQGLKPDVVILNSCVWDISRYSSSWLNDYKENLHKLFDELKATLPEETLVVWNLTMPLGRRIKGGFLVPEIEHKVPQLRYDVIEANFYSRTLADAYGMDVLDLHFHFRSSLHHRTFDGVHWNAIAHREITCLLLQHSAQAWGVTMPSPLTAVDHAEVTTQQAASANGTKPAGLHQVTYYSNCRSSPHTHYFCNEQQSNHPSQGNYNSYDGYREEFFSDNPSVGYFNFENYLQPHTSYRETRQVRNGFDYKPPHYFEPYNEHHHQDVMKSRHARRHYAPYTHHRRRQYSHDASFY
ncbi:PC-esterase domain-containing protein 1A isoform X1 [Etheostoma spectabile]|uniref:PC-esterase domain-containing protein 1A isoform X1 n=1 Tax=Etheostoma spectabile TaxID=54343 RepID=UPI0013AF44DD|nr:PC-esterase domain-containing protein 1A-like isoform X1 [Etheostoma spectabile]XP_032399838.1 PC-esterase domain-containing protein 1A-like isoform X1 [Etheostoma spectabile]